MKFAPRELRQEAGSKFRAAGANVKKVRGLAHCARAACKVGRHAAGGMGFAGGGTATYRATEPRRRHVSDAVPANSQFLRRLNRSRKPPSHGGQGSAAASVRTLVRRCPPGGPAGGPRHPPPLTARGRRMQFTRTANHRHSSKQPMSGRSTMLRRRTASFSINGSGRCSRVADRFAHPTVGERQDPL